MGAITTQPMARPSRYVVRPRRATVLSGILNDSWTPGTPEVYDVEYKTLCGLVLALFDYTQARNGKDQHACCRKRHRSHDEASIEHWPILRILGVVRFPVDLKGGVRRGNSREGLGITHFGGGHDKQRARVRFQKAMKRQCLKFLKEIIISSPDIWCREPNITTISIIHCHAP